ncbi:MAG: BatA domain-containing protein, partial [Bryobacteraceae bacterium]|nr:BatA domain-containing protein [Bryobacteraceae bacterium]
MFFANLSLAEFLALLGAASAAMVALYLLIRARRQAVVPTLRFWQQAQRELQQKRRRRIDQPLSLLLQLAALALLVLAIAQPRIGPRPGEGAAHVLLLDGSSWMQAPAVEQETKKLALAWLRTLPPQDRVLVVRADAMPAPLTAFTADRAAAARAIRESGASSTALDLRPAFELAAQSMRLHAARPGEIVYAGPLMTDGAEDLAPPPNLRLLVAQARPDNVGLTRIVLRRPPEDPVRVEALVRMRNYGAAPRSVPMLAGFAGSVVASQVVALRPGEEASAAFRFRAPVAGWLEVRLEGRDALPADDRATLELPPPPLVRVAVFSDNPAPLRPLLESDPRIEASFLSASRYQPGHEADVLVLDSFHPAQLPARPALLIRPGATETQISQWNATHPATSNLRSADVRLQDARILSPEDGDTVIISTPAGPAGLARDGEPRRVVLGFHPGSPSLRYHVAAPLLFAAVLEWLAPAPLQRQEILAASPGVLSVELPETAPAERIRVTDAEGAPLPFTVEGRTLRCFAPRPSVLRIAAPSASLTYSL